MKANDLDVLRQQLREGRVHVRFEGTTTQGKVARWVEMEGQPTDEATWCFVVVMGDGTRYEKVVPIEELDDAAMALFLKLKAAFANMTKDGIS